MDYLNKNHSVPFPPFSLPLPDLGDLALDLAEVRKKADGNKSEISQEDTASETEINTEEPLNGEEGEEEGLTRDDCEDELVKGNRQYAFSHLRESINQPQLCWNSVKPQGKSDFSVLSINHWF